MRRMRTGFRLLVQLGQPGMVLLYDRIVGGPHATKANSVRIIIIIYITYKLYIYIYMYMQFRSQKFGHFLAELGRKWGSFAKKS
jgi:hypothetical protein